MSDTARNRIIYARCAALGVIVGVAIDLLAVQGLLAGARVNTWPTTGARITEIGSERPRFGRGSWIVGRYEYSVEGQSFAGTFKVEPYGHYGYVSEHPPGTVVTVRYNPEEPAESSLFPPDEAARRSPALYAFGVVAVNALMALGIGFIAVTFLRHRRDKRASAAA